MMRLAWLFPGQGAQSIDFLRRLPGHAAVGETLREADAVLGGGVAALDQEPALRSTVGVQLGLLIAGVAQARALQALGVRPDVVAGLSVGAFGAAVVCGCLDFGDALRLVRLRAESMQRAYPSGYGMLAVSGLREATLQAVLAQVDVGRAGADGGAYLANLNGISQFVVAGSDAALAQVALLARAAGARQVERLDVAVPSHCPLLAGSARMLREALQAVPLRQPAIPYVANTTARALRTAADIARDLADSVMLPVRWHDAQGLLLELGVRCFVEMPPGQTLTRLVHNLSCRVDAVAADACSMESLLVRIRRASALEDAADAP